MNSEVNKRSDFRDVMGCLEINGKNYLLFKGLNTVGRNRTATVIIKNENVSQQHAIITIVDDNKHYVSDFQSFNGTYLEKDKLKPLQLYEISYGKEITFANVTAVYKQAPKGKRMSFDNHNIENTQILTETFYTTMTQALENTNAKPAAVDNSSYFDDDYNFADVPSPPAMNETTKTSKTGPSIHDMPTQLYSCDENNTTVSKDECAVSKSDSKFENSNTSIHDLPTQVIDCDLDESTSVENEKCDNTKTFPNSLSSKEDIHDAETQLVSIHNIPTQVIDDSEKLDEDDDAALDDTVENQENKTLANISADVVDGTVLNDSGLDVTVSSIQDSSSGKSAAAATEEKEIPLESDSQSNLHVSQLYRRTVKPIADDTEEDSDSSDVAKVKSKKKKPIPESSPELSDGETCKPGIEKSAKLNSEESSGSETDVDLEIGLEKHKEKLEQKNEHKNILASDSDTDIEDVSKIKRRHLKKRTKTKTLPSNDSSGSETDIEGNEIYSKTLQTKRSEENKSLQNPTNLEGLDDTDIIPATQMSDEDDDDDFIFMPEELTAKGKNKSDTQEIDISQKLKDLRNNTVIPQENSEESFNLGLSETMEDSGNSLKIIKEDQENDDDDKTPDISDIEEMDDKTTDDKSSCDKTSSNLKSTESNKIQQQSIFEMETQEVTEELIERKDDDVFLKPSIRTNKKSAGSQKINKNDKEVDDFFMQPTQPLITGDTEDHHANVVTNNEDDIFLQPTQRIISDSQNAGSNLKPSIEEDAIFMQPTQKIVSDSQNAGSHLKPVEEDAIFMQPTQRIVSDSQNAGSNLKPSVEEDEIFNQPTQMIGSDSQNTRLNLKDQIFMQPTQPVTLITEKNTKEQIDDIFMQPTQPVAVTEDRQNKETPGVFMQPTQPLELILGDGKKSSCEAPQDIFMQPTQSIQETEVNERSSLPLKTPSSVESQLEVMFASQTVRFVPEINTRPLNPLLNVFEGQDSENIEDEVDQNPSKSPNSIETDSLREYCSKSTLPIDELEDFQTTSCQNEEKIETKTEISPKSSRTKQKTRNKPNDHNDGIPGTKKSERLSKKVSEGKQGLQKQKVSDAKSDKMLPQNEDNNDDFANINSKGRKSQRTLRKNIAEESEATMEEPSTSIVQTKNKSRKLSTNMVKDEGNVSEIDSEEEKDISKPNENNPQKKGRLRTKPRVKTPELNSDHKTEERPASTIFTDEANVNKTEKQNVVKSKDKMESTRSHRTKHVTHGETSELNSENKIVIEDENKDNKANKDETNKLKEDQLQNTRTRRTKPRTKNESIAVNPENKTEENLQVVEDEGKADGEGTNKLKEDKTQSTRTRRTKAIIKNETPEVSPKNKRTKVGLENNEDTNQETVLETPKTRKKLKPNVMKESESAQQPKMLHIRNAAAASTSNNEVPTPTVSNVTTPRVTRNKKNSESKNEDPPVELDNTDTKNLKNKVNTKTKSKKSNVEDDSTSESSEASFIKVRSNRRSKRISSTDSESNTSVVPSKKMKNLETITESTSSRTPNARKTKRALHTDDSEDSITTTKKNKTVESTDLQTPSRNRRTKILDTTIASPDRNRRKQKPKVVFTMLDSPELESLIRSLGGMVVDSVEASTVLVTGTLKRSQKLLSAVGQGKPVCSPKWLQECKKAHAFVDPWDYILEDKEAENKWKFSLKESLNRSRNKKLFENYTVLLAVVNAGEVLKAAIESSGGKCLAKAPAKNADTNFFVVSSPENKSKYSRFLKQKPPIKVVAPEAIFDGVLRQELHLNDHMLSL